jgi:hypothetical protein
VTGVPKPKAKTAHYHAMQATATWQAFVTAMMADAERSLAERERKDGERQRATTYARGVTGGH